MFPELPAYHPDEPFLNAIGRAGGPCDGEDDTDQAASLGEDAAGWPIFGQFVAHDITADRSALQSHVLREAAVTTAGNPLGPLGGRIVAEVLITLLDHDPSSVRFAGPNWTPRGSLLDLLTNRLRHAAGKSASSFKTGGPVPV